MHAARAISKTRTAKHRINYGSEEDWTDLASAFLNWDIEDSDVELRRRRQHAYLARYAPGFRITDGLTLHELNEFVQAVSDIVTSENESGKTK